jgi:DNA invertase Pin-like site-specific DNA recombinase
VAGVLASLAELELALGSRTPCSSARRSAACGQSISRPEALDDSKTALALRMYGSGESVNTIASALGVSRATFYQTVERPVRRPTDESDSSFEVMP